MHQCIHTTYGVDTSCQFPSTQDFHINSSSHHSSDQIGWDGNWNAWWRGLVNHTTKQDGRDFSHRMNSWRFHYVSLGCSFGEEGILSEHRLKCLACIVMLFANYKEFTAEIDKQSRQLANSMGMKCLRLHYIVSAYRGWWPVLSLTVWSFHLQ